MELNQHGFKLLWIGVVTTICGVFIWRRSKSAILLAALVGGQTDIGYSLFPDLGGFANFVPGSVMTWICAAAVLTSLIGFFRLRNVDD